MHLMLILQSAATALATTTAAPTDSVGATLGLSVVVAALLQAVKNSELFPWISRATGKLNFWIGIAAAVASTAGIHGHYDMSAGGSVTIPGLHVIFQSVVQWASQQAAYKGLIVPAETLGEIRAMLARALTPPPISEGAAKTEQRNANNPVRME